jgi:hypothetical protein
LAEAPAAATSSSSVAASDPMSMRCSSVPRGVTSISAFLPRSGTERTNERLAPNLRLSYAVSVPRRVRVQSSDQDEDRGSRKHDHEEAFP